MSSLCYPDRKRFAFSILDDSENETVAELRPIYRLLHELGISATKIVCSQPHQAGGRINSCTLQDPEYLEFVLELRDLNFEIAWGGTSRGSNSRDRVIEGLEQFRELLGYYPRVRTNSRNSRENLYWGSERLDQPLLKALMHRALPAPAGYFLGHSEGSPFWWGDVCLERVDYTLNLTFDEVNLLRVNPSMPYYDGNRPFVRWWFSASDADNCAEFNQLLRPDRQERLEREGGTCIAATQLAQGFVRNGVVNRLARKRLESMAARPGWFTPVSTLLDYLRSASDRTSFQYDEWDRMQWKWSRDQVRRARREQLGPRRAQSAVGDSLNSA
jgi:hypothetical protein